MVAAVALSSWFGVSLVHAQPQRMPDATNALAYVDSTDRRPGKLAPIANEILLAEIAYRRDGTYSIGRVHRRRGKFAPSAAGQESAFYVQMARADGQPIGQRVYFTPPSLTEVLEGHSTGSAHTEGEVKEKFSATIAVALPVYAAARSIAVYDTTSSLRAAAPLESLYNLCGNHTCDASENGLSCPADCPASGHDRYCNPSTDGVCDPDCVALSPENDLGRLDPDDCAVPDPAPRCDGMPFCHANQMVICYYDKQIDPQGLPVQKLFQRVTECPPEFPCEDGYCGGAIDTIKGYTCRDNRDCLVNGVQFACHCRQCKRIGSFPPNCCPNQAEE